MVSYLCSVFGLQLRKLGIHGEISPSTYGYIHICIYIYVHIYIYVYSTDIMHEGARAKISWHKVPKAMVGRVLEINLQGPLGRIWLQFYGACSLGGRG